MEKSGSEAVQQRTRRTLLWMKLSNEPFLVFYALLPFILRKDLDASLFQICVLSALRPVLPVFSFYWSARLNQCKDSLRSNLIGAWGLARIPFLFIPWIDNVWYVIACCACYEFFNKSGIPALIEILKINIPKDSREKTFTFYFVLSFVESIFLGFLIGALLDQRTFVWQILCCVTALLALTSILIQMRLPLPENALIESPPIVKNRLLQPWKEAFHLLKTRPDFAHFQYGFMMGGFGLMFIAPSLAIFFVDRLRLEHVEIITGRSILMGVGVVLSSYFWRRGIANNSVTILTKTILMGFALFPLFLILAQYHMYWFYLAFIIYGVAQAGSHLLWNLSGTLFAKEEDSSPFSRVNILMLGLRGAVAPALGGGFCQWYGPIPVFVLGALFCLGGVWYMGRSKQLAYS